MEFCIWLTFGYRLVIKRPVQEFVTKMQQSDETPKSFPNKLLTSLEICVKAGGAMAGALCLWRWFLCCSVSSHLCQAWDYPQAVHGWSKEMWNSWWQIPFELHPQPFSRDGHGWLKLHSTKPSSLEWLTKPAYSHGSWGWYRKEKNVGKSRVTTCYCRRQKNIVNKNWWIMLWVSAFVHLQSW